MIDKFTTQKEALKVFNQTYSHISSGHFLIKYLLNLDDYSKKKYNIRLYNIFEIMMLNQKEADYILSWIISNIEVLTKERYKEIGTIKSRNIKPWIKREIK